jgi:hypothetical protein
MMQYAMKTYGGIAPHILKLGTRYKIRKRGSYRPPNNESSCTSFSANTFSYVLFEQILNSTKQETFIMKNVSSSSANIWNIFDL